MKTHRLALLATAMLSAVSACSKSPAPATAAGGNLPEATRTLLERYEKVRAALAADNFDDARFQADQLAGEARLAATRAEATAAVKNLSTAADAMSAQTKADRLREEFKPVSAAAIQLAAGGTGYHVINCPMTKDGDWLQTSTKISNPYFGRSMAECGVVKN